MGAGASSNGIGGATKLNISAMSHVVHFNQEQILALMQQVREFAEQSEPKAYVDREQLFAAIEVVGFHESDREIMDKLFTLHDPSGDGMIDFRIYVTGLNIIGRGQMAEKFIGSVQVYDYDEKGVVSAEELTAVLRALNMTLDFFGDKKMESRIITQLVDNMFQESTLTARGELDYRQYLRPMLSHPFLSKWLVAATQKAINEAKKHGIRA